MSVTVLELSGEIDMSNAWTIPGRVAEAIESDRPARITMDMSDLTFIDCSGIQAILEAQTIAQRSECVLVVSNPSRLTRRILNVLGLAERLLSGPAALARRYGRGGRRRSKWRRVHPFAG